MSLDFGAMGQIPFFFFSLPLNVSDRFPAPQAQRPSVPIPDLRRKCGLSLPAQRITLGAGLGVDDPACSLWDVRGRKRGPSRNRKWASPSLRASQTCAHGVTPTVVGVALLSV